jgi:hypothetical protein
VCKQCEGFAGIVGHEKDIHIASRGLLATGEGTEKPSLQDRLRLKVIGNSLFHHFGAHTFPLLNQSAKIIKMLRTNNNFFKKCDLGATARAK